MSLCRYQRRHSYTVPVGEARLGGESPLLLSLIHIYFAKRYTDQSLSAIGELLGGRSHATVLHSLSLIHISERSLSGSYHASEIASEAL